MASPVAANAFVAAGLPSVAQTPLEASTKLIPQMAFDGLRFCCIADTLGVGIENWSREKVIAHWERLTNEMVYERTPPYDQGLKKGCYSDDTEMMLGVIIALQLQRALTPDFVAGCFFDVYEAFKQENGGEARGGYGTFRKIAHLPPGERLEALRSFRQSQENFRNGLPGNGSGMRILPLLLYQSSPELLLENVIAQTISTHNHVCALLANFVYVDVANALLEKRIGFDQALLYARDFVEENRRFQHTLPAIADCFNSVSRASTKYSIPIFGDAAEFLHTFKSRFAALDEQSGPESDVGHQVLPEATGSFTGGKIGLVGLAHYTLYATLYCWKWTMADLARHSRDPKEAYFATMLRCISFGGDIDTLLAHVVPVSFLRLRSERGDFALPDWLVEGCVELNKLEARIARQLNN